MRYCATLSSHLESISDILIWVAGETAFPCAIRKNFFSGTKRERTRAVVGAVAKARTVKPSHGFALGNVAEVKEACASFGSRIRVIHEPDKDNPNPAYTAIRNYKSDEIQLLGRWTFRRMMKAYGNL